MSDEERRESPPDGRGAWDRDWDAAEPEPLVFLADPCMRRITFCPCCGEPCYLAGSAPPEPSA